MDSVLRLRLHRRIPPRVHQHHVTRRRQIQRHASRLQTHKEHDDVGVCAEGVNGAVALLQRHAAVKLYALDANLQEHMNTSWLPDALSCTC